jgi:hypothetical protein
MSNTNLSRRSRSYISPRIRRQVQERAGGRCEYCKSNAEFSQDTFSIDHIHPLAEGGSDDPDNYAFCCQGCNGPKQDATTAVDPLNNQYVSLFHPRNDVWKEHFRWNSDFTQVEGLTVVGRATIARLQLNRPGVVNLRKLYIKAGEEHPPKDTL